MLYALLISLLVCIITYVFFAGITFLFFLKLDNKFSMPKNILFICSLAFTPFLVSLLLHYLLWLFPLHSAGFYISSVIVSFIFLGIISYSKLSDLVSFIRTAFFDFSLHTASKYSAFKTKYLEVEIKKINLNINKILFFVLLVIVFSNWIFATLNNQFTGHDMLEYAIQAKHFVLEKKIEYVENRFHTENQFYYVGLHGFSFPLLGTWEFLFYDFFEWSGGDYFFRSISGFYALLLVSLLFIISNQYNKFLPWIIVIYMWFTYGFYLILTSYHIDNFRITMITISFLLLWYGLKNENYFILILLALFCGAQAYIHSLGVFISVFIVASYFLFSQEKLSNKIPKILLLGVLIILFGGIHYIMDVWKGTGWIFQEIKYY